MHIQMVKHIAATRTMESKFPKENDVVVVSMAPIKYVLAVILLLYFVAAM